MNTNPALQTKLYGLEKIFFEITNLINLQKLPSKILLSGPKGSGKATMAYHIINYVFSKNENHPYNSNLNDVLCCVRILDVNLFKSLDIKSNRFSIEVETMAKLVLKGLIIEEVIIRYNRRTLDEGKKLKISDSWSIIWTIIKLKLFTKS